MRNNQNKIEATSFSLDKFVGRIILFLGIILRIIAGLLADPTFNQHDVSLRYGHMDYAFYIYENWSLPRVWTYEYAQPPINAFMQAIFMKFIGIFKDYGRNYISLYANCKYLSIIYAVLTIIIIYFILKELNLSQISKNVVLAIMSFYPGLIIMVTQYSNDGISYMFIYLSLYIAIRWCKNRKISTIILLALSIGIGMLTKISVALVAFIIGPMMLVILIKTLLRKDKKEISAIICQYVVFAVIVFPIGLSYSIRNYVLFRVPFGSMAEIAVDSIYDMKKYKYTFFDRYLSFPLERLFHRKHSIYHDPIEYNIWIDLVKTSTFDEFNYKKTVFHNFNIALYVTNIIFHIISLVALIVNFVITIKNVICKKIDIEINERLIAILLFTVAVIAYISFNIKYAYSCDSNYRYVAYITFAEALSIALLIDMIISKNKVK